MRPSGTAAPRPRAMTCARFLGHFCTGIAVITGRDGQRPLGFTCNQSTSGFVGIAGAALRVLLSQRPSTSWP